MNKRILGLVLIGCVSLTCLLLAGTAMKFLCKQCGFSAHVSFGGGKRYEKLTGYCTNCEKFVYLKWERRHAEPEPITKIWDSSTGKLIPLYTCLECSKPFASLQSGLKWCPKCGKDTFEHDKSAPTNQFD